jgi:hypothetical protein
VLVIHGRANGSGSAPPDVAWSGNIGVLQTGSPWVKINITRDDPKLFVVPSAHLEASNAPRQAVAEQMRRPALP